MPGSARLSPTFYILNICARFVNVNIVFFTSRAVITLRHGHIFG
jgi:hypothetical protein